MIELVQVVLVTASPSGLRVFVTRKDRDDGFGLPSGAVHTGEDPRVAAARMLFEQTGVLFARDTNQATTLEAPSFATLRKKIKAGSHATEVLRSVGFAWSSEAMMPWSHWLTPALASFGSDADSAMRTSTRIFVAEQPAGMLPTVDVGLGDTVFAANAEVESTRLQLSAMVLRTCWEVARHLTISGLFSAARKRAEEPHPILPRLDARADSRCLLLPWDHEYDAAGQGESHPLTYQPTWATGPSRYVLEDRTWKQPAAPGSTTAG